MFNRIMGFIKKVFRIGVNVPSKVGKIKEAIKEETIEFATETSERIIEIVLDVSEEESKQIVDTIENSVSDIVKKNGIIIEPEEKKE